MALAFAWQALTDPWTMWAPLHTPVPFARDWRLTLLVVAMFFAHLAVEQWWTALWRLPLVTLAQRGMRTFGCCCCCERRASRSGLRSNAVDPTSRGTSSTVRAVFSASGPRDMIVEFGGPRAAVHLAACARSYARAAVARTRVTLERPHRHARDETAFAPSHDGRRRLMLCARDPLRYAVELADDVLRVPPRAIVATTAGACTRTLLDHARLTAENATSLVPRVHSRVRACAEMYATLVDLGAHELAHDTACVRTAHSWVGAASSSETADRADDGEREPDANRNSRSEALDGQRLWPIGVEDTTTTRSASTIDRECDDLAYRCLAQDHALPFAHFPLGSLLAANSGGDDSAEDGSRHSQLVASRRRTAVFVAHGVAYLAASATRTGDLAHVVGGAAVFFVGHWRRATEWQYEAAQHALIAMRCVARYTQWRHDAIAQLLAAAASISVTASPTIVASANATLAAAAICDDATVPPISSWATPWAATAYATLPDDAGWWTGYGAHATCMLECAAAEYLVWQLFKSNRGSLIDDTYLNLTLVFCVRAVSAHVLTVRELVLVAYGTATLATTILAILLASSWALRQLGRALQRLELERAGTALVAHTDRLPELCALYMLTVHARNRAIAAPLFLCSIVFYWHAISVAPALTSAIANRLRRALDAAHTCCARLAARTVRLILAPLVRRGAERLATLRRRVLRDDAGSDRSSRLDVTSELAPDGGSTSVKTAAAAIVAAAAAAAATKVAASPTVSPHGGTSCDVRMYARTVSLIAASPPR